MISYTPVNVGAAELSPGDGYVLAGHVTRHGAADGLSTAQCTYTITKPPVLRVCTVDYALDNGLITTSGYIDGPGKSAPVTLVVNGGTAPSPARAATAACSPPRPAAPSRCTWPADPPATPGGWHTTCPPPGRLPAHARSASRTTVRSPR